MKGARRRYEIMLVTDELRDLIDRGPLQTSSRRAESEVLLLPGQVLRFLLKQGMVAEQVEQVFPRCRYPFPSEVDCRVAVSAGRVAAAALAAWDAARRRNPGRRQTAGTRWRNARRPPGPDRAAASPVRRWPGSPPRNRNWPRPGSPRRPRFLQAAVADGPFSSRLFPALP